MNLSKTWIAFFLILVITLVALLAFFAEKPKIALIVIDGFNPDYFAYTPKLSAIKDNSQSFIINTVQPSITPTAHASIVSCKLPDVHGITDYSKNFSGVPFLFEWANKNNLRACSAYAKSYLNFFNNSYRYYYMPSGTPLQIDKALSEKAKEYANECDIIIVLLPTTDAIGHVYGPESEMMKEALNELDKNFADLIDYMHSKGVKIIIASDHGMCEANGGEHNISAECALKVPLILDKDLTIPDGIDRKNLKLTSILPIICNYFNLGCTDECNV